MEFLCQTQIILKKYIPLYAQTKKNDVTNILENKIIDYFTNLKLPETPTFYDHLILCLRKKDVIATFN